MEETTTQPGSDHGQAPRPSGIAKTYHPQEVEDKWYRYWLENQFFTARPNPDKEPYTIVIPPPNVTGVLHMGHMLNNTIQDVLIRKARMEGKEACWVPGTDHASIATEAKVVAMLKEKGISKKDLSREEFLAYAWEWREKYGGIILEQLKKLGASCDWSRTRFTMEPTLSAAVTEVFVDLYRKGLIYRGIRMVNWDPQGGTALSDEEVIAKDTMAKMYHLRYEVVISDEVTGNTNVPSLVTSSPGYLTVATSRPETIMADVAVAVNPNDPRYAHLHGARVRIPLLGRAIPVILDEYVAIDFGTGALKVTPAHDLNDYALGLKHNLPVIDILNNDGTLNERAELYVGQDRFAARRSIVKDLEAAALLDKVEEYASVLQTSERTGAVIEPRLSLQWFLKMEHLAKPALAAVENDEIKLHPPKFKNMYRVWMENVHDWCISRQLWWGQRIPAYYLPDGTFVVAPNAKEALELARQKSGNVELLFTDLRQEEDVLDTWFSAWLWPISVFDGFKDPDNADVNYFYPTNDLVTAPEILFFWVARMVMAGLEYRREVPFRNVYLTGIVRDDRGRKMSKQLGNSPDPLELIAQYGADGVRTGMLFSSPAGNDLLFDIKLIEQGRNFSNKIWNAFRLVKGWEVADLTNEPANYVATEWFRAKLDAALREAEDHFRKFRLSDALKSIHALIWDDFCAWYLEIVKPEYGQPINRLVYEATIGYFEQLMQLAHPFVPFITEEIWQQIRERGARESICVATFPKPSGVSDGRYLEGADVAFDVVSQVRNLRNAKQLSPKVPLNLSRRTTNSVGEPVANGLVADNFRAITEKLANVRITETTERIENAVSFVVKANEFFVVLSEGIDPEREIADAKAALAYQIGFRDSILKKLQNEKFVANAKPDVIERERQKLADAEAKIQALREKLRSWGVEE
ncbi:MAG: valine--tRNA ligase [Ferruginibacter sp.]|nr:valine--tRNA ligase [Cytophagales bacterium]